MYLFIYFENISCEKTFLEHHVLVWDIPYKCSCFPYKVEYIYIYIYIYKRCKITVSRVFKTLSHNLTVPIQL